MLRLFKLPKRPKFLNLDFLPESFDRWVWPLVLVSAGLHAALLFVPIPSTTPAAEKKTEAKPKTIKITSLPPIQSKRLGENKITRKNTLKSRLSPRIQKGLVIRDPSKKPTSKADPARDRTPPKSQPVPSLAPAPVEEASSDPNNPLNDFPRFPGAIPVCYGLESCFKTDKPLDIVSQFFQQELPKRKYDLSQDIVESDRKVFKIGKGGSQQFLNIFSEGQTSFYLLAPQAMKRSDLQDAVQIPPDFNNIMASLPPGADGESTDASPDDFTSPTDFFSKLGGEDPDGSVINPEKNENVETMRLVRGQTPQQLLSSYFTQSGYQPKPIATFGGGQLYELKKGTFNPFYLNLVPAKDNKGTIVVVWIRNPS